MKYLASLLLISMFSAGSLAADNNGHTSQKKQISINFKDELIVGDKANPFEAYVLNSQDHRYGRLLKFRYEFLKEMHQSGDHFGHE